MEAAREGYRKCTRCGKTFRLGEMRYGNPYFAFQKYVQASHGYYCDNCWKTYEEEAKKRKIETYTTVVFLILLGIAVLTILK